MNPPAADAVTGALERLLASPQFIGSPRASRFLRFLVKAALDGRRDTLKEYVLGVEVFDRGPSFDPRIDTIVRVEAVKLRKRLRAYYSGAGRAEPVIIQVPKGGYTAVFRLRSESPRTTRPKIEGHIDSIAVLPFANLSPEIENEYFSEGLAEEILNALTRVPGLRVVARTSSFAFRGHKGDIRSIGEALNVGAILQGSVRRAGRRVRVSVQLVHALRDHHLWSETYDRELTEIFSVEDEIAAAIAGALEFRLARQSAATRYEPVFAAYEAHLKGRYYSYRVTPEAALRARKYFQQAIALDPKYSDPHYELGTSYIFLCHTGLMAPQEALKLIRTHAQAMLEISQKSFRANALLGFIASVADYDWESSERHFRQALSEIQVPADVRALYAFFHLRYLGRFHEGIAQVRKAIAMDPLNVIWRIELAGILFQAEQYEDSLQETLKAAEINEDHWATQIALGINYLQKRLLDRSIRAFECALNQVPLNAQIIGHLAGAVALKGDSTHAEELIMRLMKGPSHSVPIGMAIYHAICEEPEAAAEWFERAIELHDPGVLQFSREPTTARVLRGSSRWPDLLKKMNLA